jgi:hypothetical protein
MTPGHHESVQSLLMVQHQLVPIDHGMLNSVVANPSSKLWFGLCVVAHDYNVERLY